MKAKPAALAQAELLRKKLLQDNRSVHVEDFGTKRSGARLISDIAAKSVSPQKFSSLYHRMIAHYKLSNVIELGTSLGINTLYLAAEPGTKVASFEGSGEIAKLAELTFEFAGAKNIRIVQGNLQQTLSSSLQNIRKIDFAFIDANHTYEATVQYFTQILSRIHEKSVMVIDDIHYSKSMERAWHEIKTHELVYASADLFRAGILFFDPSLNKQHVILQF